MSASLLLQQIGAYQRATIVASDSTMSNLTSIIYIHPSDFLCSLYPLAIYYLLWCTVHDNRQFLYDKNLMNQSAFCNLMVEG